MISQQQDLVFFNDSTLVSKKALSADESSIHTISHCEGTRPTWLVNTLIENCLEGTANSVNRDLAKIPARASVMYVSFLHNKETLVRSCKKQGLDLARAPDFHFVDAFTNLFREVSPHNSRGSVEKLFKKIEVLASEIKKEKVLFIDSPEILLAGTDITSNDLLISMSELVGLFSTTFVVVNTDGSIADLGSVAPQDPVYKITDFYVKLFHKSTLNVNISPLSTGKAKDITGCLTVSKGALPLKDLAVAEKEYVFHVSKEGSVKMYFR